MPNSELNQQLQAIVDQINQAFETKSQVRDRALSRSRAIIRHCANAIRATHRGDHDDALALLETTRQAATEMIAEARQYPDIYHAGYTQDALKEMTEAHIVRAVVLGQVIPTPESLQVEYAAWLNGLAEATSELRRFVLDALRRGRVEQAESTLGCMDDMYSVLVTVDFPDAITNGLRRSTDMVRAVLERTRGDVTTAVRQEAMRAALAEFEKRVGMKE